MAPRKKREETRREKSRPLVDAFFAWCDEQAALVLDDTPISKALGYARNQRVARFRFLDDGRLPLGRVGGWRGGPVGSSLSVSRVSPFVPV
jgi:transposase